MSWITSVFTFKNKFGKVFNREKITGVIEFAKTCIEAYKEYRELSGEEKKAKVDKDVQEFVSERFTSENDIVQWIIDRFVDLIPVITQLVYNLLKEQIKGITNKGE